MRLQPRAIEDLRLRLMFLASTFAMRGVSLDEALADVREAYETAGTSLAGSSIGTASPKDAQTMTEEAGGGEIDD